MPKVDRKKVAVTVKSPSSLLGFENPPIPELNVPPIFGLSPSLRLEIPPIPYLGNFHPGNSL